MTIGGIDGGLAGLYGPGSIREKVSNDDRPTTPSPTAPSDAGARVRTREDTFAPTEAPSGPPEGVDVALWSVLTTEERDFFLKARDLGPITYRPGVSGREAAPRRGGRIDVRI